VAQERSQQRRRVVRLRSYHHEVWTEQDARVFLVSHCRSDTAAARDHDVAGLDSTSGIRFTADGNGFQMGSGDDSCPDVAHRHDRNKACRFAVLDPLGRPS
jgi:hypothetical protein